MICSIMLDDMWTTKIDSGPMCNSGWQCNEVLEIDKIGSPTVKSEKRKSWCEKMWQGISIYACTFIIHTRLSPIHFAEGMVSLREPPRGIFLFVCSTSLCLFHNSKFFSSICSYLSTIKNTGSCPILNLSQYCQLSGSSGSLGSFTSPSISGLAGDARDRTLPVRHVLSQGAMSRPFIYVPVCQKKKNPG